MFEGLFIIELKVAEEGDSEFAVHTDFRIKGFTELLELISCILDVLKTSGINLRNQQVVIVTLFFVQELHLLY